MSNILTTILSSASVSVVLSAAGVWLARTWIGERMRGAIADEYARTLETLKDQLKRESDAVLERVKAGLAREVAEQQAAAALRMARRFDAITACYVPLLNLREAVVNATTPFADHHAEAMQLSIERTKGAALACKASITEHYMDLPAGIVALCREISNELSFIARSWEFHFGRSKDGSEALHMARLLWEKTEPIGTKLQALESAMRELLGERVGVTTGETGQ